MRLIVLSLLATLFLSTESIAQDTSYQRVLAAIERSDAKAVHYTAGHKMIYASTPTREKYNTPAELRVTLVVFETHTLDAVKVIGLKDIYLDGSVNIVSVDGKWRQPIKEDQYLLNFLIERLADNL
jgi:hypothetical protein